MASRTLKTLAASLELDGEAEAAEYIMQSLVNGNRSQAREYFNALSNGDQADALDYIVMIYGPAATLDAVTSWIRHRGKR